MNKFETHTVELTLAEWEVIRSALRYYANSSAYPGHFGNERQSKRARRAGVMANHLDKKVPTTIDEDGTGRTVKLIKDR